MGIPEDSSSQIVVYVTNRRCTFLSGAGSSLVVLNGDLVRTPERWWMFARISVIEYPLLCRQ
jgi:hypothetical protein